MYQWLIHVGVEERPSWWRGYLDQRRQWGAVDPDLDCQPGSHHCRRMRENVGEKSEDWEDGEKSEDWEDERVRSERVGSERVRSERVGSERVRGWEVREWGVRGRKGEKWGSGEWEGGRMKGGWTYAWSFKSCSSTSTGLYSVSMAVWTVVNEKKSDLIFLYEK